MKSLERENITGTNHTGNDANFPLRYLTASSILGTKIYNLKKEYLGKVHDIMLQISDGEIEYIIISHHQPFTRTKFFGIAFELFTLDPLQKIFILDLDKNVLKTFPGFNKDHWPETNLHLKKNVFQGWGGFISTTPATPPATKQKFTQNNITHESSDK